MSQIKEAPISWLVQRLLCDCGGEFTHMFNLSYSGKPFTHVCNKCSIVENREYVYPRTVWKEDDTAAESYRSSV